MTFAICDSLFRTGIFRSGTTSMRVRNNLSGLAIVAILFASVHPAFGVSKEIIQLQTQVQTLSEQVARMQQSIDERMTPMRSSMDCCMRATCSERVCTWVCSWMISLLTPKAGCTLAKRIATMARPDRLFRTRIDVVPDGKIAVLKRLS